MDGLLPPDKWDSLKSQYKGSSPAINPTPPPPTTEHEIDRRFSKKVRDSEVTLTFPSEDAGDLDPRPCIGGIATETLLRITTGTAPQSSKTGGVYYLSAPFDSGTARQLYYLSGASASPQQITYIANGIAYYHVSPDGKKILLSTDEGVDEVIRIYDSVHRIFTMALSAQRINSATWSPDSTWFAYTSNARNGKDLDLYRYQLRPGKSQLLAELQGYHVVTDVSPDARSIALTQIRSATESDVMVWTHGSLDTISRAGSPTMSHAAKFTRDSRSLFLLSDGGKGTSQIYLVPLVPGRPAKVMTSEIDEIDNFAIDDSRSALLYRVNSDGYSTLRGWTVDQRGLKVALFNVPKLHGVVVSAPSFTRARGKMGFFYSKTSPSLPPTVWLSVHPYNEPWMRVSESPIPRRCFTGEELVHYPTFDGRLIPAFLFRNQAANVSTPVLLFIHDGPATQFQPRFHALIQLFLKRGYNLLAPNIRGSTGYGRSYTDLDNGRLRSDAIKDVVTAGKWLLNSQYARPGRLAIYGEGYGGYLALRAMQASPGLFSAGAAAAPILSLPTFLQNTIPMERGILEAEFGTSADSDYLKSISPIAPSYVLSDPVLLFAMPEDRRRPSSEWELLARNTKARSIPFEISSLAHATETTPLTLLSPQAAETLIYFLDKSVKAGI